MFFSPISYQEPLFRPPSEAYSLILQVTYGCSWNRCAFCEMYSTKKFQIRDEAEILEEIKKASQYYPDIKKVFLADGDALVLPMPLLLSVLNSIRVAFPGVNRISSYALPRNILNKTEDELKQLYDAGLKLIYLGIESGDDEVLRIINKGETYDSTSLALKRFHAVGMHSSVMILLGLGGKKFSQQHAINSAKIVNETQPLYCSTLVLSFPFDVSHFKKKFKEDYQEMNVRDLLEELRLFISNTELNSTVFRSDHASNYLSLKGTLGRDKEKLISEIDKALNDPSMLRPEWMRGL